METTENMESLKEPQSNIQMPLIYARRYEEEKAKAAAALEAASKKEKGGKKKIAAPEEEKSEIEGEKAKASE